MGAMDNETNTGTDPSDRSEKQYRYGGGIMSYLEKMEEHIGLIAIIAVLLMLALAAFVIWRALPPRDFTILVGREGGAYYNYALEYQKIAADRGFTLNIETTAGSPEILKKLEAGEAGIGFVQGGVGVEGDPAILSTMAGVFYEPVWLFYRKDAVGIDGFANPGEIEGLTVSIGEAGSGTAKLAREILDLNDIDESNATIVNMSAKETAEALKNGDIDFGFFVSSFNNATIQELLRNDEIALANFRRASAYVAHIPYLTPVVMPAGSLDFVNEIPSQDITLMATVANLVVRKDFHPDLLRLMTIASVIVHERGGFFEKRYEFPNLLHGDLPVDKKELAYLQRIKSGESTLDNYLPFWAAALIDRFFIFLLPVALIVLPLLSRSTIIFTVYSRRKVTRWYKEIRAIDVRIPKMDLAECDEALQQLEGLDEQLQEQMRVSESYMASFYDLRWHLEVVQDRIIARKNKLLKAAGLPPVEMPDRSQMLGTGPEITPQPEPTPPPVPAKGQGKSKPGPASAG